MICILAEGKWIRRWMNNMHCSGRGAFDNKRIMEGRITWAKQKVRGGRPAPGGPEGECQAGQVTPVTELPADVENSKATPARLLRPSINLATRLCFRCCKENMWRRTLFVLEMTRKLVELFILFQASLIFSVYYFLMMSKDTLQKYVREE